MAAVTDAIIHYVIDYGESVEKVVPRDIRAKAAAAAGPPSTSVGWAWRVHALAHWIETGDAGWLDIAGQVQEDGRETGALNRCVIDDLGRCPYYLTA